MFKAQKTKKQIMGRAWGNNELLSISASEGFHARKILYSEAPPIHVWIPNHPQATIALSIAGMLAPFVPKLALTKTGKGIPYFAPACPFNIIGIKTMQLPRKMVSIACHQFMPPPINELANMYVGMHKLMLIQRAA